MSGSGALASTKSIHRSWTLLAGIYGCASLVRLAYLAAMRPPFEGYHWAIADDLLAHGVLGYDGVRTAYYEPLYPLFVAGARYLIGDYRLAVQVLQALVDSAGAVLLFCLVEALTARRRAALIAAALYASYPLLVRHAVLLQEFSLASVLLIAFAYVLVTATAASRAALAGLCLGAAILTRAMVAPALVLIVIALVLARNSRIALVVALTVAAVTTPWLLRNSLLNGSIGPTRSGINLYVGNSRYAAALLPEHNTDLLMPHTDEMVARERPDLLDPAAERQLDRFYRDRASDEVRARPLATLGLKLRNVAYFFWPRLVPSRVMTPETTIVLAPDGGIEVHNSQPRPLIDELAYALSYVPVLAAALAGIWIRRAALPQDAVLWCLLVTFVAVHAVYFPATVYRTPIEFVLLFYAAVAVDGACDRLGKRRGQTAIALTG